jgi:cytochrome b561
MTIDPLESAQPLYPKLHYRLGAVLFHWAMAVLVVVVGVLGLLHDSWPRQTQAFWINIHALTGIL